MPPVNRAAPPSKEKAQVMSAAVLEPEPQEPRVNYLNATYGIRSRGS